MRTQVAITGAGPAGLMLSHLAGALGILTAVTQPTPNDLRREIDRCRSMTGRPFGVNLTILPSVSPPPHA